jgi:AraC-like DNA-binding protein
MKRIENVKYWRDPDLEGVETYRVCQTRHVFPKHAHEEVYSIGLMEIGASYCLGREKEETLTRAGQVVLINPGQVHSGVPYKMRPITYRMVYLDRDFVKQAAADALERNDFLPELRPYIVNDSAMFALLSKIYDLMAGNADLLEKESLVTLAVGLLVSEYAGIRPLERSNGSNRRAVRLAKEFLASSLDEKITLDQVAKAVGLSRYYFLRLFKQETGLSPHTFRTQLRIDLAKDLLLQGMPPAEVALETGFTDQSHLTNKFRQFTCATPMQYLSA